MLRFSVKVTGEAIVLTAVEVENGITLGQIALRIMEILRAEGYAVEEE